MLENFLAYFAYTEYLQFLYIFFAMPNLKKVLVDGTPPLHFWMQVHNHILGFSNDCLFLLYKLWDMNQNVKG